MAHSCSLFDPTQDTESIVDPAGELLYLLVAAYSIRHRILKVTFATIVAFRVPGCSLFDPTQDTERTVLRCAQYEKPRVAAYSIRHRILKDIRYNAALQRWEVAAYSIRHRILKAVASDGSAQLGLASCSLFDPTQDTERIEITDGSEVLYSLQPIRSDTGY